LAQRSLVLDALWSASNFTAPAFTSLFTGCYPHQHGVFDFKSRVSHSPVYEVLKQNGARTGAVTTFRFFNNLLRNIWSEVETVTETRGFDYSKNLPRDVTASALEWLQRHGREQPFCLFVHYDGPHAPYRLPDEYAHRFDTVDTADVDPEFLWAMFPQNTERNDGEQDPLDKRMLRLTKAVNFQRRRVDAATLQWLRDKYDASVLYNDHAVGDLFAGLASLELADDTVVAVISDHGEEFLEHGGFSHGHIHLYEEVIRTVGIIHDPAAPNGAARLSRPVSQVDLWPTLLAVAGATHLPQAWAEKNFCPHILHPDRTAAFDRGDGDRTAPPIFCHGKFKIAVRNGRYKLIRSLPSSTLGRWPRLKLWTRMLLMNELRPEVYDLATDPQETDNLARQASLRKPLERLLADHLASPGPVLDVTSEMTTAQRERIEQELKDLGYM
jgi:arylsulfatase A-like enzyme